jgi:hypothetical protein
MTHLPGRRKPCPTERRQNDDAEALRTQSVRQAEKQLGATLRAMAEPDERDEFPTDDAETDPDLAKFTCPSCASGRGIPSGQVVVEKRDLQGQLRTTRRVCEWCGGLKWVNRETLAMWGAQCRNASELAAKTIALAREALESALQCVSRNTDAYAIIDRALAKLDATPQPTKNPSPE